VAWIQVHQQLKDHRKLLAAADELDIEPAYMLGLLISFWLWALDNTPTGSLEGISNRNISRAAQWTGDADELVETMTNAGFLDKNDAGTLEIHDWYEYTGKLIDQREAEKLRSRRRRAAAASPQTDQRTADGQTADGTENNNGQAVGRVDQTRVDQSRPNQSTPESEGLQPNGCGAEPAPYKVIVDLYHEICKSYPTLRNISAKRKKAIAARWKEYGQNLDTFRELFELAEASAFLKGKNGRNWTADFNWLMNSENMAKTLEGKYTDDKHQRPQESSGRTDTMGVLADIIADEEGGDSF
jgi:hypothetical protein